MRETVDRCLRSTGEKVKDLLVRSKLPGTDLMKIWYATMSIMQ